MASLSEIKADNRVGGSFPTGKSGVYSVTLNYLVRRPIEYLQ